MRRLFFLPLLLLIVSCSRPEHSADHVETLTKRFMTDSVFPRMKNDLHYQYLGSRLDTYRVSDYIADYRYVYDHLSYNRYDSTGNKKRLDSVIAVHPNPDSVINITVAVGYKTIYRRGNTTIDSIRLSYDPGKDRVSYWPF